MGAKTFVVEVPSDIWLQKPFAGIVEVAIAAEGATCVTHGSTGIMAIRFNREEDAKAVTWLIREEFHRLLFVKTMEERSVL